MRLAGVVLLLLGLVAVVVGSFSGCGSLFSWKGRHAIEAVTLPEGSTVGKLVPEPGRRYTVSVQVVFDREGLEMREAVTVVEARLPFAVRVKDEAGTTRAEAIGWLDPNEPPSVLYGQSAKESRRMPELVVERLVGPFIAASRRPLSVEVDLGADQVGHARIAERRMVIYDDALPSNIKNAFVAAAFGGAAMFTGMTLLVIGWFRRRRTPRKRGGIPASDVV